MALLVNAIKHQHKDDPNFEQCLSENGGKVPIQNIHNQFFNEAIINLVPNLTKNTYRKGIYRLLPLMICGSGPQQSIIKSILELCKIIIYYNHYIIIHYNNL